jgi:hypothetical protein
MRKGMLCGLFDENQKPYQAVLIRLTLVFLSGSGYQSSSLKKERLNDFSQ